MPLCPKFQPTLISLQRTSTECKVFCPMITAKFELVHCKVALFISNPQSEQLKIMKVYMAFIKLSPVDAQKNSLLPEHSLHFWCDGDSDSVSVPIPWVFNSFTECQKSGLFSLTKRRPAGGHSPTNGIEETW